MKKIYMIIVFSLLNLSKLCAIDSLNTIPKSQLGLGYAITHTIWGPKIYALYHGFSIESVYGLPSSTPSKASYIREIASGYRVNMSYSFWSISNMGNRKGKNYYWPIVVGVGHSKINEKNTVKGYKHANGSYAGFHYFIGLQLYWSDKRKYSDKFGFSFYLGKNQWDFDNSVLVKTKSGLDYNTTEYDFYISLYYYFL